MLFLVLVLIFVTVALIGYAVVPFMYGRMMFASEKRQQAFAANMEQLLPRKEAKHWSRFFIFFPFIFSLLFYFIFPGNFKLVGAVTGLVGGFVFPGIYIQILTQRTKEKFNDQLIDALMIMSSSFRGGLSLIQAFEAVVEEMPDPINKELGAVLGENKMGVSLEEALNRLYNRMPSAALQQMTTSILLARETGGNLPVVFSRIVTNIRERKKIQQTLDTLTIQGKIQGFVMSVLPVAFGFVVYNANRGLFEHMLKSDLGRVMLLYAIFSEIVGVILIWRISTFKDI